jgi:trk system potassium uptake protein TrkA
VGSTLSVQLETMGHTVAVIDKRAEAFARLPAHFTGQQIVGHAIDRDRLTEAGIDRAAALAAVTSGDNSNILVARIARETFEVPNVVARIYDPGRAALYQRVGIPTVATVSWSTDQALRRLLPDETRTEWVDPTGQVVLVERALPTSWAGRRLADLEDPGRWQLVALTRAGQAALAAPSLIAQEGDIVLISALASSVADLDAHLADPDRRQP